MNITTKPRKVTQTLANEVIKRIANSAAYKEIVTTERAATVAARKKIIADTAAQLGPVLKQSESARARLQDLTKPLHDADAALTLAKSAFQDASVLVLGLQCHEQAIRGAAYRALRPLADPRIHDLSLHLDELSRLVRSAFRSVPNNDRTLGQPIAISNSAACAAAGGVMRTLQSELDDLVTADYGIDIGTRLRSMRDTANSAARTVLAANDVVPELDLED